MPAGLSLLPCEPVNPLPIRSPPAPASPSGGRRTGRRNFSAGIGRATDPWP